MILWNGERNQMMKIKKISRIFTAGVLAVMGLATAAQADLIMIGRNTGNIDGRDEFNIGPSIPASNVNFGVAIASLSSGFGNDLGIGRGDGFAHIRDATNMVALGPPTTNFTGLNSQAVSAVATRPNGDLVIGTQANNVFVRDRTNLTLVAPSYTGAGDGLNFNNAITALAILPNGDLAIGNANGEIFLRSGTDLFANAAGVGSAYVNFGVAVNALTVTPAGNLVIGLASGVVDTRPINNLVASLTNVNFGVPITALGALSNGDVAIGLGNGGVSVRDSLDVVNGQSAFLTFTGGAAISALAVTSSDNLAIGTADNLFFMRQADLLTTAGGADGLNFGAPITALAAIVPEPGSLALLGIGATLFVRRRR
jgi:PEP-CTERM motif